MTVVERDQPMIDLFTDAVSSQITRRELIGRLLAATATALIGTWVVVRGLAFFGDAMAQGVLPGIALAAVWGLDLTLGAIASMIVMVFGINLVHLTTRLSDDTGSDFGVIVGHRAFLALSIDASNAATLRLHPRSAHIAMLTLLPLTVVASFRGVGTLLVFGLLVAPPAVT